LKTEALLFTGERGLLARRTPMCGFCRKRTVGFADMDADGYLDRLYVHRDYQGRGVAAAQANKKAESPVFRRWPGGGAFRCVLQFRTAGAAGKARAARRREIICYDFARFSLSA
jgi:GNAT superfamily N-acetyltransferase